MLVDLMLIGLAIALAPLSLAAFFVLLQSEHGLRKGGAFIVGWVTSLAIVVTLTVALRGDNPPKAQTVPSQAVLVVKLLLGVALVGAAIRHRRRMGLPKKPKKPPKWQAGVDHMSLWFAAGLAPLLQPWGLIAVGAATVVDANVSSIAGVLALLFFCVLASSSYFALELYAVLRPQRSEAGLTQLRAWGEVHADQIIVLGCLVVGAWLIAQSTFLIVA